MRDGKDLKCPKRHCDKVYPNKESLRLHIIAHYQLRIDAAAEAREDESVSSATSVLASRLTEDAGDQRCSPMSDASDSSWPSPASVEVSRVGSVADLKRPQEEEVCDAGFTTSDALIQHSLTHPTPCKR
ncbi:unnamed protein product [Nippostrongylus brasiliensis]|uniref:Transcription factor HIVEP3 (inferred by orthology to a human protein) n=1 Tax=Nippostrongylus brasiliensis TaxID=27835 RepID=A0A0N4XTE3_NIPBR|nr:unnamed protein product [Nippostrongylus brasiliensis]